jgi:hypothetical protein
VNYSIDTVQAVVYLMGVAQNQAELDKVMSYARTVPYVKQVVSYVKLAGTPINPVVPPGQVAVPQSTATVTGGMPQQPMSQQPAMQGVVAPAPGPVSSQPLYSGSAPAAPLGSAMPRPPVGGTPYYGSTTTTTTTTVPAVPGRPAPIVDNNGNM